MSIHPQYTFDKDGNPVGVFISIDEWDQVADVLNIELPEWQKKGLDAELENIAKDPSYLLKWDEIKERILLK